MPEYLKMEYRTKSASLPNFIFARQLYKYRLDSLKSVKKYFRLEEANTPLSSIIKGIKRGGALMTEEGKLRQTLLVRRT